MIKTTSLGEDLLKHIKVHAQVESPPPDADEPKSETAIVFSNYILDKTCEGQKTIKSIGIAAKEVHDNLLSIAGEWPKQSTNGLFVERSDHRPIILDTSTKLFAWLDKKAQVDWAKCSNCITQERFYEYLRMETPTYDAIEFTHHYPTLDNHYYMTPNLPDSDGSSLEALVEYFTPFAPEDRELIKAFIVTLFWGGPPGKRPAFLITGPDPDPQPEKNGRGVGKTTLVNVVSKLVDGLVSFSPRDDIDKIKTRLLSKEASGKRLAILDNLKTLHFSWDQLEALITASTISGHRMYQGEGQRPNNLVWAITLNGASLSKDMAERCIVIRLGRPNFDPHWQTNVEQLIADNRWEIISDAIQFLSKN